MTKNKQKLIYDAIAQALTDYMYENRIKHTALANKVGEQFNTIRGITEGKVCSLHHVLWLEEIGINVAEVIKNAVNGSESNEAEDLADLV